ncbi:helix-turn-helix domain-containing protein [Xanthobacteraceae bacterium A53D]
MTNVDRLLSLREAVDRLSISRTTAYRMAKAGDIQLRKLGSRTYVSESELARVISEAPVALIVSK